MPQSAAEKAMDAWVLLQRYGNNLGAEFNKLLDKRLIDVKRVMGSDDYERLIKEIDAELNVKMQEATITAGLGGASVIARREALIYGLPAFKVTKAMVVRGLNKPMPHSLKTPAEIFSAINLNRQSRAVAIIKDGISQGSTITQMKKLLTDTVTTDKNAATAFARTSTNAVSNNVKQELYSRSASVDRVLWSSTLDGRTSDYCKVLDSKIFPKDEGPRPPAHPNCRSQILPVFIDETNAQAISNTTPRPAVVPTSDFKTLQTRGGKARKPSKAKSAQLTGTQANYRSYESYIKSQPAAYQRQVLGNRAYEKVRDGESLLSVIKAKSNTIDLTGLEKALN